ncbi:unnamed protein product [Ectocarpus fasciculatus]
MFSPPTVQMTRCPVCDGSGKTGTTLGFGGTTCALCHGKCFLRTEPNPCPCCNANGGFPSWLGLKWITCRLCHGLKYLMEKPLPCPKCSATGQIKGLGGVFSTPCDLCEGQRYVWSPHKPCIKCYSSSAFYKYFFKCINCNGIRYSRDPQYLCPRCNSVGRLRGYGCTLCSGHGVIHHDVAACANCNGAGEVKRTLSLLLGNQTCPTCQGQGYFAIYGAPAPTLKPPIKGKRAREDEDDEQGDGSEDGRAEGGRVVGGSEPRPRVKQRTTPADKGRRLTISDLPRPEQQQPPATPLSRDDTDIRPNGGSGSGDGGGVFRLGVATPVKSDGKRRRA